MADVTTEELDGQIELSRQRFKAVTVQISEVLCSDVAAFVSRACKHAFLTQPAVADGIDDGQLATFKVRGTETGKSAAEGLAAALADEQVWLDGPDATTNERSLEDAGDVWSHIQSVNTDVAELLSAFGFDGAGSSYAPPMYFVGGLYLPTLVEHYWKLRKEIDAFEGQKVALAAETVRSRLESRWNDG